MKVITNQGEYATVKKAKGEYYEVQYDNGKSTMILKDRCEELVPISHLKAIQEELEMNRSALFESHEKHVKVATEIHKLHFELGEQIDYYSGQEHLNEKQLIDRYRCTTVFNRLVEILGL